MPQGKGSDDEGKFATARHGQRSKDAISQEGVVGCILWHVLELWNVKCQRQQLGEYAKVQQKTPTNHVWVTKLLHWDLESDGRSKEHAKEPGHELVRIFHESSIWLKMHPHR